MSSSHVILPLSWIIGPVTDPSFPKELTVLIYLYCALNRLSRCKRLRESNDWCPDMEPPQANPPPCIRNFPPFLLLRKKKATNWIYCFVHPIFSSFGFWYFGHFSCVHVIFLYFCNFVSDQKPKTKMEWTKLICMYNLFEIRKYSFFIAFIFFLRDCGCTSKIDFF